MSLPLYPKYKDSGVEWMSEGPERWLISTVGLRIVCSRWYSSKKWYSDLTQRCSLSD
jgi:hypothetical protein